MKKCALVIGHKKSSPGAVNGSSGITEFEFNDKLAIDIEAAVDDVIIQRIYRRTYQTLPDDINAYGPDFIISLHCNAFNGSASGTEVLYYHKSSNGKAMAEIVRGNLVAALGLNDRGSKQKTSDDRGGYLLKHTNAPCVIAEPFFIDNDSDLKTVNEKRDKLVEAYASSISRISGMLGGKKRGNEMPEWNENNKALTNTLFTLCVLDQLSPRTSFKDAGEIQLHALPYWTQAGSGDVRQARIKSFTYSIHNITRSIWRAGFENGIEHADAIKAIQNVLLDDTKKVKDLGFVIDENYLFPGETSDRPVPVHSGDER